MEESAKRRRAELIEEINRHRARFESPRTCTTYSVLGSGRNRRQVREMIREIEENLRSLNEELHDLNVQLIRDGLSADAP